ncbi:conserved hypothetical protein [Vibrio nigripulchritudo MADA3029]|uniref:glycosyltransferase family 4 protein n=1 Tax=Vibrio nigripulchritudo TaxID=28173 RepID=UPI0003B1CD09|nr:glycosyltransferase family 4 protein [Vibrio nigripulchritudo]CCN47646.1 conserved hypothetical protein [Vibrio nigripulchritudo MADA3020]CCN56532.1 conserved hypothetical protein [Vibrio nigripulchritudo MADA3021]CCN58845.1 conserved hypothetical protein [Vibrio nigripulchritudo MADA3029]
MNKSITTIVKQARESISKGNYDLALRLTRDFIETIVTEPILTGQVFSSKKLDLLCQDIGALNLPNALDFLENLTVQEKSSTIIYIVSRLQNSGGHLHVILNMIAAQTEKKHLILSTEVAGASNISFTLSTVQQSSSVEFLVAPRGSLESKLTWLQGFLLAYDPEHVYLFNHHQDSVAASAIVPKMNIKGSFCHHGDHHICLGVHINHLRHIDFHPMGYHHCRDNLGIDNIYLPLICHDKGLIIRERLNASCKPINTFTIARSNKVEIPYFASYISIVPRILETTGGVHLHIGKLTPKAIRYIKKELRKLDVPDNRFVYIEWTDDIRSTMETHEVDVYISSFPLAAGMTIIEVMSAGIPVILHSHIFSRVHSSLELAYPEAFKWGVEEELLLYLSSLTQENLAVESLRARHHYELYHQPKILSDFLENKVSNIVKVPELSNQFNPCAEEWAAWVVSEINIKHILYRSFYRFWRRLRAFLNISL